MWSSRPWARARHASHAPDDRRPIRDGAGRYPASHPGARVRRAPRSVLGNVAVLDQRIDDASQHLKVGQEIEAKYFGVDRKTRVLQLSIKAKDEAETAETLAEYNKQASEASSGTTKLGALLREQLGNKGE